MLLDVKKQNQCQCAYFVAKINMSVHDHITHSHGRRSGLTLRSMLCTVRTKKPVNQEDHAWYYQN